MTDASEPIDTSPRPLAKLRLQTAPEQIVDRVLAAIAVGVLSPGERLPERELAEILGVARNTVRLALTRLDALGVVEVRRGRHGGRFVRPLTADSPARASLLRALGPIWTDVEDLLDYRSLIEQQITRTAAERRTGADIAALTEALARYREATGSPQVSREADHALHRRIAEAAGNPHLAALSRDLVARVNLGFAADPFSTRLRDRALDQHERMVAAIIDGDGVRAAATAREHFEATTSEPWRRAVTGHVTGRTRADRGSRGTSPSAST